MVLAQEAQHFVAELFSMLKEQGVSRVAVQNDFGVWESLRHEHSSLRRWQGGRRLQLTPWPVLDNLEQARKWNSCVPSIRPAVPHRP